MGLWGQLRALVFARDARAPASSVSSDAAVADDSDVGAPVDTSMRHDTAEASVAGRQDRAAGRILEDESLRGDLADDEFQPLLDWALAETDRVAASTEGLSEAEADARTESRLQTIREVVRAAAAAITAHAEGDAARRSSELAFIGTTSKSSRKFKTLDRRLKEEPNLSGPEIATLIVGALGGSSDQPAPERQQEKAP
jgi:hypothetical protein